MPPSIIPGQSRSATPSNMYKDKRSRTVVETNSNRIGDNTTHSTARTTDNTHSSNRASDNTHSSNRASDNTHSSNRASDNTHSSNRTSGDLREKLSKSRKSCETSRQDPQRVLKEKSGGDSLIEFTKFPRSSGKDESSDERKNKQVCTLNKKIYMINFTLHALYFNVHKDHIQ